jgi:CheY-like chemotaxis protein
MSKLILHLDDEAVIRELIASLLSSNGYRMASVAAPTEALNAAEQNRPDLFISDLQLEEGDGLETIRALRVKLPDIPVMILTGVLIDPRIAARSVASGANIYLPKTAPLSKILAEVRRLIGE